jgi:DNA-binding MarR family transcriptional regulator
MATEQIDRKIHEPVRLAIMTVLSAAEWTDFPSMVTKLQLTRGNLSSHVARLSRAGYVEVRKRIIAGVSHTDYRLTKVGRKALKGYWAAMESIRKLGHA